MIVTDSFRSKELSLSELLFNGEANNNESITGLAETSKENGGTSDLIVEKEQTQDESLRVDQNVNYNESNMSATSLAIVVIEDALLASN